MDLRERRQLDMAEQMAKVRARARPWRSIIATALALAAATVSRIYGRRAAAAALQAAHAGTAPPGLASPDKWISIGTAIAFPILALAATMGLSGKARATLQPRIDRLATNSGVLGPRSRTLRDAATCHHAIPPSIPVLLGSCRPSDVARLVMAIVVNAVQ